MGRHHATFRGHAPAVEALLRFGANPLLATHSAPLPGQTPRALAEARAAEGRAAEGTADCIRLLAAAEVRAGRALRVLGSLGCLAPAAGCSSLRLGSKAQHAGMGWPQMVG